MKHFDFPLQFRALFDHAVSRYASGQRGPDTFFNDEEKAWLAANGLTAQNVYDYAEDQNNYEGEPGFEHALAIELVRRDYFFNVQGGRPATTLLDDTSLPGKSESVRGISWLPRLLLKARAKLRGELPPSLMFGCGGDRAFFKEHDILPSEFLSVLGRNEKNEAAVIDWVVQRSASR